MTWAAAMAGTSAPSRTLAALLLPLSLACTAPEPDPFAGTPADGPMPEIGPAPADYRPTAAGAPSTDIWLGVLDRSSDGAPLVRDLFNATDRDGYDNQPRFGPDGNSLYYTSAVDSIQTEAFRYVLDAGRSERLTRTPEASEFSPTPIPGQEAFSAIREVRGKQYLWRYDHAGAALGPVFSTAEPVGYHAWANERVAVLFVLGDPPVLRIGDALSGTLQTVVDNPGRSIHRIAGSGDISFVHKLAEGEWWIERLDPASGRTERLVRTLPGREDYAWTPHGEILMGDGAALHYWTPDSGWRLLAELSAGNAGGAGAQGAEAGAISRIAVSPAGDRIALVRERRPGSGER